MYVRTKHWRVTEALISFWNIFFWWYPLQIACISVAALSFVLCIFKFLCLLQFFWIKMTAPIICFISVLFLCARQAFWMIKVALNIFPSSLWTRHRRQFFWRDTAASVNFLFRILLLITYERLFRTRYLRKKDKGYLNMTIKTLTTNKLLPSEYPLQ